MLINPITVTALLKVNKDLYGKMYNIADIMEYKDQKLAANGKSLFEPFQKAGGIYLIVPELLKM